MGQLGTPGLMARYIKERHSVCGAFYPSRRVLPPRGGRAPYIPPELKLGTQRLTGTYLYRPATREAALQADSPHPGGTAGALLAPREPAF